MRNIKIDITIDQASVGSEAWASIDRVCEMLAEAVQNEYPAAVVTVSPEASLYNGGRVNIVGDCDGYASGGEDGIRDVIKHWSETILTDGAWAECP